MWWDVVWCAVPEMWFDVKIVELWWWDVECISHRTSSHHSTTFYIASFHIKHHLWHYSKPHHIPRQTIPHHITHFISHQHLYSILQYYISNCTVSATLGITPHVALHPISRYIPHKATFHVLQATFQIAPWYTGHIMHCTTISASHHVLMTHRILHNCIIPPHLTVITPKSTSHYHVDITFHIAHQYTTTRDILHPTTCHISHQ